jgi:hypothetical protein
MRLRITSCGISSSSCRLSWLSSSSWPSLVLLEQEKGEGDRIQETQGTIRGVEHHHALTAAGIEAGLSIGHLRVRA